MKNRITRDQPTRPGFGLLGWLEQTKITLPLKGVECRFSVCGDLLNVEVDQIYHQNCPQPLDCLYTFPLPAAAAVYQCELHVNERVIRARVEEKEQARRLIEEKKAAGHRTALVEMERDNLFTLSLGNVQPNDLIVVRFAYFQTLTRLADWTSFSIPFCPGIRYVPGKPLLRSNLGRGIADDTDQVPDASRISPPRLDQFAPDAAYLSVQGEVENPFGTIVDLSSPTHPVLVRDGKATLSVTIADQEAVPDCDFVVRWTERRLAELQSAGWVYPGHQENFALVRLESPLEAEARDDYEQDVYFLIDRSGSMQGLKWQKATQAFVQFLRALGPRDRAWATFFETKHQDLAEKPLPASQLLTDPAVQNLVKLGVTGGTELFPALTHVLGKCAAFSTGRPVSMVLITDGQVGNEAQILAELSKHTQLRVHTFGIDTVVNDGFLQKAARGHRGSCCLMTPSDDIVGAVARLGARLRRPMLTSIQVKGDWELPDGTIPDLHAGESISVALRGNGSPQEIIVEGQLMDGTTKSYRFELSERKSPALPRVWVKRRIEAHLGKGENAQAIELGKKYNLICEGASFMAWDEAEKVVVSQREIYQPSMEPMRLRCIDHGAGLTQFSSMARRASGAFGGSLDSDIDHSGESAMNLIFRSKGGFFGRPNWTVELENNLSQLVSTVERALRMRMLQDLKRWCIQMFEQELFRTSAGWEILRILCGWVCEGASFDKRMGELERLHDSLANASDTRQTFLEWMERTLPEEVKKRALEKLKARAQEIVENVGSAK